MQAWRLPGQQRNYWFTKCLVGQKTGHDTMQPPGPTWGKADLLKTVAMSAASSLLRPNFEASNPRSWALDSVKNALRFFSELWRPWLALPASACNRIINERRHFKMAARN